jgi:hypothetical protein
LTVGPPLPVYPDQRISSDLPGWSGPCQQATSHAQSDSKEAAN